MLVDLSSSFGLMKGCKIKIFTSERVSCSKATLPQNTGLDTFLSQFFPPPLLESTSLFLRKLEEDHICLLIFSVSPVESPILFKDKLVSADTDQSPQIHLDLEQTVTEYYSFPRSKVLNGQEKKDDVLTL
jgi:hypothetical protein